jgi:hypothetical protein
MKKIKRRSENKLTPQERKRIARIRNQCSRAYKGIVTLIAQDLRLGASHPFVREEVECACRTWEALLVKPEPTTPLQRLLAERSNLLVAEREVLRAVTRRESEDGNEFFYC